MARWWQEARASVEARQIGRARRYLRWILAVCPENETAWLWLARLAGSQAARLAYLHKAITLHPHSSRLQNCVREARDLQLQASVGKLEKRPANVCRLPRHAPQALLQSEPRAPAPFLDRVSAQIQALPIVHSWRRAAQSLAGRLESLLPAIPRSGPRLPIRRQPAGIQPRQETVDLEDLLLDDHLPGLIRVGERFAIVQTVSPPSDGISYGDPRAALRAIAFERWLVQSRECAQIEIYIRLEANRPRARQSPPPPGQSPKGP